MELSKGDIDTLRAHPRADYSKLSDTLVKALATKRATPPEASAVATSPVLPAVPNNLVRLVTYFYPEEAAEFEEYELRAYAQHYTGQGYAEQVRMVGVHLKDRLAKRAEGVAWSDDSRALAAQQAKRAAAQAALDAANIEATRLAAKEAKEAKEAEGG